MREILSTSGTVIALVDDEDYDKVKDLTWTVVGKGYIQNIISRKLLHNVIMGIKSHDYLAEVDHINRDKSDNRKCNLRIVTRQINNLNTGMQKNNTSGYKGVSWHKQRQKWRAFIMLDYKQISLGLYENKEDAYKARLEKENEILTKLLEENDVQQQEITARSNDTQSKQCNLCD